MNPTNNQSIYNNWPKYVKTNNHPVKIYLSNKSKNIKHPFNYYYAQKTLPNNYKYPHTQKGLYNNHHEDQY